MSEWRVYLLRCADGALYCGITNNLQKRLAQHNGLVRGGAKYTRGRRPVSLLASAIVQSKTEALKMEAMVKSLPRRRKLSFFADFPDAVP